MLKKNVVRGCLGIGAFTIIALCLLVIFYFWTSIKTMYTHRMMTRDEIKMERERLGIDNYREEEWCPVCRSDSVVELRYGFGIGTCMVSSDSKRFACKKCDYSWGRLPHYQKYGERAFNEKTICEDKEYSLDVDFDKAPDIVCVKNGNVRVYRLNPEIMKYQKVSNQVPYCWLAAHQCCEAHTAYTTFDYVHKTIYIEAHYGCSDMSIRQFKKADNGWEEVIPVKPMSIINRDLYPTSHLNKKIAGRRTIWYWFNPGDNLPPS